MSRKNAVGVFIIFLVWFFTDIRSTETFMGLLSAGIAIALKDIITNIAGWIFIMPVRPLSVGDRIQIGSFSGDSEGQRGAADNPLSYETP